MRIISIMSLAIFFFLSGCMGTKIYQSKDKYSKAQNVLFAAGAYKNLDRNVTMPTGEGKLGEAALFGMSFADNASSWVGSRLGAGLLMGVGSLLTDEKLPESFSGIIAWMPKEMAADKTKAANIMSNMLEKATDKAVSEIKLPPDYTFGEKFIKDKTYTYPITGALCGNEATCQYEVKGNASSTESLSPDFLGGAPAWAWGLWPSSYIEKITTGYLFKPKGKTGSATYVTYKKDAKFYEAGILDSAVFPDLELYLKISENLPDWFFIYLAPQGPFTRVAFNNQGHFDFIHVPVILNQGKVFPFVKPKG